jgi:RNA polymerase sigma-70 factor (ECF subfamily)
MTAAFPADELARQARSLRALAAAMVADTALADDAVQETCAIALQRPPRSPSALPAWLRAVLRRCVFDLVRGERRRLRHERAAAKAEAVDAVETAQRLELQQELLAAVRALDEPYRSCILQRYFDDRSPTAIARHLGVPVKTVKTRLSRALQQLRQRLAPRREDRGAWAAALATGAIMHGKQVAALAAGLVLLVGGGVWWSHAAASPAPHGEVAPGAAGAAAPVVADALVPAAERARVDGPAAAAGEPYGGLTVRVVWADGDAAPGIALAVTAEGEPRSDRNDQRLVSDANGIARAARVHAGTVRIVADRGGALQVDVPAGAAREATFVLPAGVDVVGTVVDAQGLPVADARVCALSGRPGWLATVEVARSRGDGAFAVRAIDPQYALGALAAGLAPSPPVAVASAAVDAEGKRSLQLRCGAAGARVEGRVVDADERPVAAAIVALGACGGRSLEHGLGQVGAGISHPCAWTADVVSTDADGRFAFASVEPGQQPLAVRAEVFAQWRGDVRCVAGTTASVGVRLQRGVVVHGVVRDDRGRPVADARVAALPERVEWLVVPPEERGVAFPKPRTRTAADGSYRLEGIAPGELHLLAGKWDMSVPRLEGARQDDRFAGTGEAVQWDPVLPLGHYIRGRLVDADGAAVPMHWVVAMPESGGESRDAFSQRDGTFAIAGCADEPYAVATRFDPPNGGPQLIWHAGVRPDGSEVELRLPRVVEPARDAELRGRIVDLGGRGATGLTAQVAVIGSSLVVHATTTGDRFSASGLASGTWRVLVQVGSEMVHCSAPFELAPAQVLDVGDIVTSPRARLRVVLHAPPGVELGEPYAALDDDNAYQKLRWNGVELRADNATAGAHRLHLIGKAWHATDRDVDLPAGQDTEVAIDVVPAVPRRLDVVLPPFGSWKNAALQLLDGDGRCLGEQLFEAVNIGPQVFVWRRSWPLVAGTLAVRIDGGAPRTFAVDLRDPATRSEPLRLTVR